MTSREQQAHQTYEHILQTAETLLETASYETLSVNEICEKAGISKGGFYHHFSSKDQMIALLIGRQMERLTYQKVAPLLGKKDAFSILEVFLLTVMNYLKKNPNNTLARCCLAISEHKELTNPYFSNMTFTLLHDIVLQGIQDGHIRTDLNLHFCESFLTATFSGILLHAFAYDMEQSPEDFVKDSMQLIAQVLSKKSPG